MSYPHTIVDNFASYPHITVDNFYSFIDLTDKTPISIEGKLGQIKFVTSPIAF